MLATQREPASASVDERVRLHGAGWDDYERLLALRGESAVPRIAYLEVELELKERGLEPDECYIVGGRTAADVEVPDFSIEVVWTSGGIDKLAVYAGLGVPEVWFYEREALRFFRLRDGTYEAAARSAFLPDLDPALLVRFMTEGDTQSQAVRLLRAVLQSG